MDGGAWQATVHGAAKGRTQLSGFTFTFQTLLSGWYLRLGCFPLQDKARGVGVWHILVSSCDHRCACDSQSPKEDALNVSCLSSRDEELN